MATEGTPYDGEELKHTFSRRILIFLYLKIEFTLTSALLAFRRIAYRSADVNRNFIFPEVSMSPKGRWLGENVAIVITTFEARFDLFAIPLIKQIRQSLDTPIFLMVNSNYTGPSQGRKLQKFLSEIAEFNDVYPTFFGQMQGCASMWNESIANSGKENYFIFNDDISVNPQTLASQLLIVLEATHASPLIRINESFSHFLITKKCVKDVGWFDERFLGFGEEDIDYLQRYAAVYKTLPESVYFPDILTFIDSSHDPSVSTRGEKYSLFNRCLIHILHPSLYPDDAYSSYAQSGEIEGLTDPRPLHAFKEKFYPALILDNPYEIIDALLSKDKN